jgi:hypothetical protein
LYHSFERYLNRTFSPLFRGTLTGCLASWCRKGAEIPFRC